VDTELLHLDKSLDLADTVSVLPDMMSRLLGTQLLVAGTVSVSADILLQLVDRLSLLLDMMYPLLGKP
jgi:hypothetical protein